MIVLNELSHIVTFLHIRNGESYTPIGTAFFISIVEEEHFFTYIVTCKHVVERYVKSARDIYMRLNRSDRIDVAYEKIDSEWIYHDSEAVDLAVARHIPRSKPREMYAYDAYGVILTRKEQEVRRINLPLGYEAIFIGLFAQYTGNKRNFPVVRHGRIALITDEPVLGAYGESDYHILECQAHPGNSGSPVWVPLRVIQGNNHAIEWRMWGVIHGYFRDAYQSGEHYVFTHLGISLVTPADHIIEILNKEVFIEQRKNRIDAGKLRNRPAPAGISVSEPTDSISRGEFFRTLDRVVKPSSEDEN